MTAPTSAHRGARRAGTGAWLLILLLLQGCGGGGGGGASEAAWRRDIDFLVRESQRIHPDLFHSVSRDEYLAAADALKDDVAGLSRNQIFVRLKRLLALPAVREDGHTLMPMFQATGFRIYPLRLYEFDDGVFVIDANPPYDDLIGSRLSEIGNRTLADVNALVDPLITRDNESNVKAKRTLHYVVPELLQTLGVIDDADQGDYLLEDGAGNVTTRVLAPIDTEQYAATLDQSVGLPEREAVLYLSRRSEYFWLQLLENATVLYVRYSFVWFETAAGLTIEDFSDQIAAAVAANPVTKVIVDVRHNGGGNAFSYAPLLAVLSDPAIDQPNRLYVLTDRMTFSAAANFVTELDRGTGAVFVGESTGGSLNNYGDVAGFDLPNSGFGVRIPTIYWEYGPPGDPRLAITPDIAVDTTASDYFDDHDPVLQAVLAL